MYWLKTEVQWSNLEIKLEKRILDFQSTIFEQNSNPKKKIAMKNNADN